MFTPEVDLSVVPTPPEKAAPKFTCKVSALFSSRFCHTGCVVHSIPLQTHGLTVGDASTVIPASKLIQTDPPSASESMGASASSLLATANFFQAR